MRNVPILKWKLLGLFLSNWRFQRRFPLLLPGTMQIPDDGVFLWLWHQGGKRLPFQIQHWKRDAERQLPGTAGLVQSRIESRDTIIAVTSQRWGRR